MSSKKRRPRPKLLARSLELRSSDLGVRTFLTRCLMALICLLMPGSAAALQNRLTLDHYLQSERVSSPRISPDGSKLVYTRQSIDKLGDRWESGLWMMDIDGSENRHFSSGSSPRWSPDGSRIAYLTSKDGDGTNIFVYSLEDRTTKRITRLKRPPSNLSWAPDGRHIAFSSLVPEPVQGWDIKLPERPAGATWVADPRIIERLVFRRDRMGFLEPGRYQVFLVSTRGGQPRRLTNGVVDHGGGRGISGNISWTPDSREIVYSSFDYQDWEYPWKSSDIFALEIESGRVRRLTTRIGPDYNPVVSPDGRWVAYAGYDWSNDSYLPSDLYVVGMDGSNPRNVSAKLDRSLYSSPYGAPARSFWWSPDSAGIYFNPDDRGTRNLHFASRAGVLRQVTQGEHVLSISDVNARGQAVGTLSSFEHPPDLVTFSLDTPVPRALTSVHEDWLRDIDLGQVEEVWFPSLDGFRIQGWLIKPPDFDGGRKYPLILTIHGGPHSAFRKSFDFAFQQQASAGYLVLYMNPRGSTGYGAAFANAINNAYPGKDYDDLMAGVDEVVSRGFVDERNLFVYGCSGGGVLTAWIVGHTGRFAAASSNCPVTDWSSLLGNTDGVSFYWNFKKMPWEDSSEHARRSPMTYVGNVRTPTLLINGEQDRNTPIGQAEQFYRALKLRGIPTALIRLQEQGHGTSSRPSNFMRTQLYLQRWFERHSRGK